MQILLKERLHKLSEHKKAARKLLQAAQDAREKMCQLNVTSS